MNTHTKTPSIQLTPEIIVSPRLYRFIQRYADNLGRDIISFLQEEVAMNIEALQDYRHTMRKAAAHGMSYREYVEYESQLANERRAAMQI
ncbi:MAG: hypothetical protein IKA23_03765 [Akkermansia sp.]|nr:hypothetical protein [Akkermansia sp.]